MEQSALRYPQLAKEPLLTSRVRGNPENRVWAKVIDFALIQILVFIGEFFWSYSNWVLPALLWAYFDQMGRGQSPGKWLLGLHTVEVQKGNRANLYHCLLRNLPFILLSTFVALRAYWSWLILAPVIAWVLIESYFIFYIRTGLRIGDVLATTRVNDYKDEHTKFIEQFLKEEEVI